LHKNISVEEARHLMKEKDVVVLDVRLKEDWDREKIRGALNIFFGEYDFDEQVDELSRDNTYIVYCQVGIGSLKAISVMEDLGFDSLYNMSGGIKKWKEMGYEVK